ncbi:hypothetical protein RN001_005679 [Aquatica leii]|uniref:Uncharacterized protein n=1 Tax=Aquatica leii TaxID=1421715 RepID=A0AAN7SS40_9COLE|nr:hypothetical protein RN001_005679 [Aquatica leii]
MTILEELNKNLLVQGIPIGTQLEIECENMDLLHKLGEGKTSDDFYKACFLRILNQNVEQKKKISNIEKILEDINSKLSLSNSSSDEHRCAMKNLIPLRIGTMEELEQLNKMLQENGQRNFMTDCCPTPTLPNQDSKTVKQEMHKVVGHIYNRIMTNELAINLNMCGQNLHKNTPKKEGMKKFSEILAVTFEAIKPKAHLANLQLSQAQSDSAVGEWLRLAKNRLTESKDLKRKKWQNEELQLIYNVFFIITMYNQ